MIVKTFAGGILLEGKVLADTVYQRLRNMGGVVTLRTMDPSGYY